MHSMLTKDPEWLAPAVVNALLGSSGPTVYKTPRYTDRPSDNSSLPSTSNMRRHPLPHHQLLISAFSHRQTSQHLTFASSAVVQTCCTTTRRLHSFGTRWTARPTSSVVPTSPCRVPRNTVEGHRRWLATFETRRAQALRRMREQLTDGLHL
ncbi:hypothetical protein OH76DRAFT_698362 [Lentinus brumalis]|uniref:Uncharacterized protein n=1 Tax=Lentinus brumalis TaxID=2498619 RepID=A0A371D6D3_9APHY|nr:hypothetical protein OH76DRAFT_698362 [Polyporus brumalis]